ncbi:uncharacterized protein LOC62_07G008890 [Vanrija pseudolonga]|uniref:BRCT domain-containing protein n=1 Tax=Vanrija pseudolonga TaxID=143232 RepID=A0AAF1BL36_9TREE|nr:hypothetical protein LOC62_07G008890 [Vanrija pseudolonga]
MSGIFEGLCFDIQAHDVDSDREIDIWKKIRMHGGRFVEEDPWGAAQPDIVLVQLPPKVCTTGAYVHFVPYHIKPPGPFDKDFEAMMWKQAQRIGDNSKITFQMDWVQYCINVRRACALDLAALELYSVTSLHTEKAVEAAFRNAWLIPKVFNGWGKLAPMSFHLDIEDKDVETFLKIQALLGPIQTSSIIMYSVTESRHLSRRQLDQLRLRRPSSIVVNVKYAVDCMAQNKVLDYQPYLIQGIPHFWLREDYVPFGKMPVLDNVMYRVAKSD